MNKPDFTTKNKTSGFAYFAGGVALLVLMATGVYAMRSPVGSNEASVWNGFANIFKSLPNAFFGNNGATVAAQVTPQTSVATTIAKPATPTQTIIQQNTYPITQRTVVEHDVVTANGISGDDVAALIQQSDNQLRKELYAALNTIPGPTYAGGGNAVANLALAQRIDSLSNVTITNATIHGVSGLTAADIPALSYLSTTNATTTTFAITTIANCNTTSALTTDASGNVMCGAVSGGGGGGASFAYPFVGNATTTLIAFNGGATFAGATTTSFAVTGSSTIGTLNLTNALGVANGGTGITTAPTYGQLLLGNNSGGYSLVATSSLGIVSGGGGTTFAYPFIGNATTTQIAFNGGATFAGATTTAFAINGSSTVSSIFTVGGVLNANGGLVGSVTGNVTGTVTGNAGTATVLQNSRNINGVAFNGSADITIFAASSTLLGDTNTFAGSNVFTQTISGSISGNAATVTTNANLTGVVTSVGNNASFGSFNSATLATALTDETGFGAAVFGTNASLTGTTLASTTFTGNLYSNGATTTNLAISGTANTLLKTLSNGAVVAAIAGTDYLTSATTFAYPFPNNATTTSIAFNGGATFAGATTTALAVTGSSTINTLNLSNALSVANGGTGSTTLTGILVGNGTSGVQTATVSGPLTFSGSTLAINQATLAQNGFLSSTDFATFNGKLGSTSLSAGAGIAYNSSTGVITNTIGYPFIGNATSTTLSFTGGLVSNGSTTIASLSSGLVGNNNGLLYGFASTSLFGFTPASSARTINTTYPIQGGGDLTADRTLTLAFGTTTANSWSLLQTFTGGFLASASSTVNGGFTVTGTTTTTNFAITSLTSTLLKTNSLGQVVAAVAGTDYLTSGTTFGYLFPGNATSTLTQFNGGLTAYASSTIGNGSQIGGLTISGGATTTGNAYFAGNLGIGTTSAGTLLSVGSVNGINFSTATSTFNATGGVNLTAGCYAVNNTCLPTSTSNLTSSYTVDSGSSNISVGDIVQYINGNARRDDAIEGLGTVGFGTSSVATSSAASVVAAQLTSTSFVVAYTTNLSNGIYAKICNIVANSFTCGSQVQLDSSSSDGGLSIAALSSTAFVMGFEKFNSQAYDVAATVSGTVITAGTPVSVDTSSGSASISIAALSSTTFVMTFQDTFNGSSCQGGVAAEAVVGTVSGATITNGSNTAIGDGCFQNAGVAALSSTSFVVAWTNNNSFNVSATAATVSGTTITFGTNTVIYTNGSSIAASGPSNIVALGSSKFVYLFKYGSASPQPTGAIVGTVSGTSVTPGSLQTISSDTNQGASRVVGLDSSDFVFFNVTTKNSVTSLYVSSNSVSGTTVTTGTNSVLAAATSTNSASVVALDTGHVVTAYVAGGNSSGAITLNVGALTQGTVLGMATNAAVANGTVSVASNGVVTGLSGLTAGSTYYWNPVLGLTASSSSYKVGIALSATSILLNSNTAATSDQFFGDAVFANNFRIAEMEGDPQGLRFKNQFGRSIATLDENGNLAVQGMLSGQNIASTTLDGLLSTSTASMSGYDFVGNLMGAVASRLGMLSIIADATSTQQAIVGSTDQASQFVTALFGSFINQLQGMGVYISTNLTRIVTLVAEHFTVGSSANPAGITLYDTDTHAPYCVQVKSGALVYLSGTCSGTIATSTTNTSATMPATYALPTTDTATTSDTTTEASTTVTGSGVSSSDNIWNVASSTADTAPAASTTVTDADTAQ